MLLRSVFTQYVVETSVLLSIAAVAFVPALKRRDPRRTLAVLTGLNILRLGGAVGAVAAMARSPAPAMLVEVAVGDGLAGALAVGAFVLLLRRSSKAWPTVTAMNAVGIVGILVSEAWLTSLELRGDIVRDAFIHAPTIGAAVYTTLHVLAFHVLRARRRLDFAMSIPADARQSARETSTSAAKGTETNLPFGWRTRAR
jgi:hypothetical protein